MIGLPALVLLVGASGSGKTTWADDRFAPGEVVSSDRLRAAVGRGETDLDASDDAFVILDAIVDARLGRGLTVVVDTLGLDPGLRTRMLQAARRAGVGATAVLFDTPPALCRSRNRSKPSPVPAPVLTSQLRRFRETAATIADEGWDSVVRVESVVAVSERPDIARRSIERRSSGLRFGVVVSSFPWPDEEISDRLRTTVAAAETAGFDSVWVMDHLIQIPQVGRRWDPMLEGPTTLAWLAAATDRIRLGTLVANASLRNPAHLAKIVATLDVLSGGRAICGIGAGWWERELVAYGSQLDPVSMRLDRLEDALQLLPSMWGPGTTDFAGRTITVEGAECYPRPLQDRVPILVGGQGRRRTLRLVAAYADACNLRGGPADVESAHAAIAAHCHVLERDVAEIEVTHLSSPLVGVDRAEAERLSLRHPRAQTATLVDHIGRFDLLAEAGVDTALVVPVDLEVPLESMERMSQLVTAFR